MFTPRGPHRHGGKGPSEFLGGPPGSHDRGPQPEGPALRAVPAALLTPAPAAAQGTAVPRLQRPRAVPAPRRGTAAGARHARHVAPPGHLHQHRPLPQAVPDGLPGEARQPGGASGLVPGEIPVPDGPYERSGSAHLLPPGDERPRPAALHELRRLHRAGPAAQQEAALVLGGPQQEHLAGVRLRGVLLAVAVVPVVPEGDQTEVLDRREHRGPGPDHGPHGSPPHREPLRVPLLGTGVGGEHRVPPLPQQGRQRGVDPGDGPPVRQDDECPSAGGQGRRDGPGQLLAPLRPGQRVPHGPGRAAGGQRLQEGRTPLVPPPGPRLRCRGRRQGLGGGALLGPGVARRHRELQDVGEAARVPVGDRPGQPEQFLAQHRLGRDDLGEGGQRPGVVGLGQPLDEEAVDQPAALTASLPHPVPPGPEPHPDPHARLGLRVQLLGDGVVEVPVEVQHALVDEHPRHGQLLGERGPPPRPRLGPGRLRLPQTLPDERELLGRRTLATATRLFVLAAHACILTKHH